MRPRLLSVFVALVLGVACCATPLVAPAKQELPSQHVAAALLVDVYSGEVLHSVNAEQTIPPASLTKIMTLYLAFDALAGQKTALDEVIEVTEAVRGIYGATLGLQPGDALTVGEAIRGVAVASANDAATALAVHLAGSVHAFVQRMNEKAATLSLYNSYYANPHGLPVQKQQTTAADVAALARSYIHTHPEALGIHSSRQFQFRGTLYANRNTLLGEYPELDGLKTGFIKASGHCLVATAKRNGVRLLSVVLGAASPQERDAASVELLDFGFASYAASAPQ